MRTSNLLVTMSGGTTTVINATLAGIIKAVQGSSEINKVYAGIPGISGVFNDNLLDLTHLSDQDLERLKLTPSSGYIGTTRIKVLESSELTSLASQFQKYEVGYFLNIGGNGTIRQTMQIGDFLEGSVQVASLPKTVDNDLGDSEFRKVYFTPGYPSCINYWIFKTHMLNQENLGAFSHDQVLIGQTFGRKTGFLAAAARLADPDRELPLIILLPEDQRSITEVYTVVDNMLSTHGRAIVILSEGYEVGSVGEKKDYTGQVMYGSSQTTAMQLLINGLGEEGVQARGFLPGVDQRSEIVYTLAFDIDNSFALGSYTISRLLEGRSNFLSTISQVNGSAVFDIIPFEQIADFTRQMPVEWIDSGNFDVSDNFVNYAIDLVKDSRLAVSDMQPYRNYLYR